MSSSNKGAAAAFLFFGLIIGICGGASVELPPQPEPQPAEEARIVGGQSALIEEFPYQVSMRWTYGVSRPSHFCGGSIVSQNQIVTAAHCVQDKRGQTRYIKIYTGTSRTDLPGNPASVFDVKAIKVHPGYVGAGNTYQDDIAIVTLSRPIEFSSSQRPIGLPSQPPRNGASAVVSGWGIVRPNSQQIPANLQKSSTRILTSVECRRQLPFNLRSTQVCATQRRGVGVCSGDSGGPLAVDGELVGIASYVVECAGGRPDVYTNVYSYVDFIRQNIY